MKQILRTQKQNIFNLVSLTQNNKSQIITFKKRSHDNNFFFKIDLYIFNEVDRLKLGYLPIKAYEKVNTGK